MIVAWGLLCMSLIYSDFKNRLIYHWQVFLAFGLSCIGSYLYGYSLNFEALFLALVIGFICWKFNLIGGGDVKLISALIVCFSWSEIGLFLLLMSMIGLALALITFLTHSNRGVPYAPAISLGHLFVFMILI